VWDYIEGGRGHFFVCEVCEIQINFPGRVQCSSTIIGTICNVHECIKHRRVTLVWYISKRIILNTPRLSGLNFTKQSYVLAERNLYYYERGVGNLL
jgi:hypothetical protein